MFANLTGWHALIVLAVVLLVFGSTRLPALARSVGQSVRILKTEVTEPGTATAPAAPLAPAAGPSGPASPPTTSGVVGVTVPVVTSDADAPRYAERTVS